MNNPGGQTKILVTHALHILPQVGYIYTVADGQIMERGTYPELIANDGVVSRFVKEFGSTQQEEMEEDPDKAAGEVEVEEYEGNEGKGKGGHKAVATLREQYEKGGTIIQDEERNICSVSWRVYGKYLFAGNGSTALVFTLVLVQGAQVLSSYWLVFWQDQQFNQPAGFYVCGPLLFFSDGNPC